MAEGHPLRVLLIVTGSTLRAEEMDRPLAYYLKQRIEQALAEVIAAGRDGLEGYVVRVVADFRWIHDDPLQNLPTISLGGPGVNALSAYLGDKLPGVFTVQNVLTVQMDLEFIELVASVWGMDHATTVSACDAFVERYLDAFMRHACA